MRAVRYAVGRSKEERPKNREELNRIETFESALNLLSFHSALTVFLIYCGCAFAEEKLKRDKRIVKQQKKLHCHAHVSAPAPWDILRIIGLFVTWQQRSRISLSVWVCVCVGEIDLPANNHTVSNYNYNNSYRSASNSARPLSTYRTSTISNEPRKW